MNILLMILKWICVGTLLIVLLVFTNSTQAVQPVTLDNITIQESEDNFLNQEILLSYLHTNSVHFDNSLVKDFSASKLEEVLNSHPGVKNAEVFVNQKGNMGVLIEQKKAVVRIKTTEADYFLDEFGHKMLLCDNYYPKLIVATGDINSNDHQHIFKFIKLIEGSDFWSAQIIQIHFGEEDIFLIPRVGNQKINIGNFDNITDKLANLERFYNLVMPYHGWQRYSEINLKFKNQIVCVKK